MKNIKEISIEKVLTNMAGLAKRRARKHNVPLIFIEEGKIVALNLTTNKKHIINASTKI